MIRTLLMIAFAGFVLALGTITAAVMIGGPDAIARGGWSLASGDWSDWGDDWTWNGRHHHHGHAVRAWRDGDGPDSGDGAEASRTLTWSGANSLRVSLPADIRYVQSAGPAAVTVSGDKDAVGHVVVSGEQVRFDGWSRHWWPRKLSIVVHAPNVSRFDLSGANELTIEDYSQDHLSLDVSGACEVTAKGQTQAVDLDISGTGDVDLSDLKSKGATVHISGAGGATIAPTEWARLDISGMGDIRLLTHPGKLDTNVSGAGRIRQSGGDSPTPSPAPGPKTRT